MKNTTYNWIYNRILSEQGEEELDPQQQGAPQLQPQAQQQPPQPTPEEVGQQQKAKGPAQGEPFKELSGQTIVAVSFQPNGANGGIISIKTKNSHLPFKISWVNSKATIQDTSGNVINLSENKKK